MRNYGLVSASGANRKNCQTFFRNFSNISVSSIVFKLCINLYVYQEYQWKQNLSKITFILLLLLEGASRDFGGLSPPNHPIFVSLQSQWKTTLSCRSRIDTGMQENMKIIIYTTNIILTTPNCQFSIFIIKVKFKYNCTNLISLPTNSRRVMNIMIYEYTIAIRKLFSFLKYVNLFQ